MEEYGRYMDIEYQKQNVDDPLNKKWENIKSAIKKAAYYCGVFCANKKRK